MCVCISKIHKITIIHSIFLYEWSGIGLSYRLGATNTLLKRIYCLIFFHHLCVTYTHIHTSHTCVCLYLIPCNE